MPAASPKTSRRASAAGQRHSPAGTSLLLLARVVVEQAADPTAAPAAAPNPALPPIAPRTAPAAAPSVVPVTARCCVSDMPAHPPSTDT
jgi:hypothetical protein